VNAADSARRLTISGEVRQLLPSEALRHAMTSRDHIEVHCQMCGGVAPPEFDAAMVLLLHMDPLNETMLRSSCTLLVGAAGGGLPRQLTD
jgi:hypothetical protein